MLREIKGTQRLPRKLSFSVDGTGTASILEGAFDASLVDNGVGDYTISFVKPFARTPVAGAPVIIGATSGVFRISAISASSVRVLAFAVDGTTAQDVDFHMEVQGWDTADKY